MKGDRLEGTINLVRRKPVQQVEKVFERISQPPPSPVAAKILGVTQDGKAGVRELAEVITKDQGFTARILKIANSAYYGQAQRVTTASRAVSVLGFDTIKALALTLYTFGPLHQDDGDTITVGQLWEHSLGCAVGARLLAAHGGQDSPEEAFVAGLLHDMGKALFYQYFRQDYIEAVRIAEEEGVTLFEAEKRILGTDHATAGGIWARKWNLPEIIQQTISHHHDPLSLPEPVEPSVLRTVAMVHVADLYCEANQIGKGGDSGFERIEEGVWSLLSGGEEKCRAILEPVVEEVRTTKELLGLSTAQKPAAKSARPSLSVVRSRRPAPAASKIQSPQPAKGADEMLGKFSRLIEVGKQMALLAGLEQLIPNVVCQAKDVGGVDAAAIYVSQGDLFKAVGVIGLNGLKGKPIPAGDSLVGWVARMGEPMVVNNIEAAPPSWEREFFAHSGCLSHLFLPVEWAGERIAVLSVHNRRERHWSPEEISLFNAFVGFVAVALENARLYRDAEKKAAVLQVMNQELESALNLKKRFLSTVTHELRTPMNVIIGYSQLITDDAFGDPGVKIRTAGEKVLKEAGHMLRMINDLLDISQIDAGTMKPQRSPVEAGPLLDEVSARMPGLLQDRAIRFRCDAGQSLPTLFADPDRLKQILGILLDNAAKFTNAGQIVLRARSMRGGVEFSVEDTGIGIAEEDQKTIFDGFSQVEEVDTRRHGGLGLGLYVVQRLLEVLGGTVSVQSELGKGSIFRVWVPKGMQIPAAVQARP